MTMEILDGYWICSCGNLNSNSFTWCLECAKDRVEDAVPPREVQCASYEPINLNEGKSKGD